MKNAHAILFCALLLPELSHAFVLPGTTIEYPFSGPPESATTTALHKDSPLFTGWADGYTQLSYGTGVDDLWKTPQKALGQATSDTYDIVSLGNGGQITLTFSKPIVDGPGFDLAVFENGISDTFLELAWVEVSSDGIHFCRFPNFYAGTNAVGGYAGHDTTLIYGLASKYRQAYGTPFDLSELTETYSTATSGVSSVYTAEYKSTLTNNYPYLDTQNIRYVRIIDILGDGSAKEASGRSIYDPTPTFGSGGFDLEAVGVIHQMLTLPQLQHIYVEPVPNLIAGATNTWQLRASASSGLPVRMEILSGPTNTVINIDTLMLTVGSQTFTNVELRAWQNGNAEYAPSDDVHLSFSIVASNSAAAPKTFAQWCAANQIASTNALLDSDGDSASNFQEYLAGTGPTNAVDRPEFILNVATNLYGDPAAHFTFRLNRQAYGRVAVQQTDTLSSQWSNTIPRIVAMHSLTNDEQSVQELTVELPINDTNGFYRLLFQDL